MKRTYKKEGLIHLSQTKIKFKSKIPLEQIQYVKVLPKNGFYELHVVYIVKEEKPVETENYAIADLLR